ncbi:ABC transporter ATP-binding protein [Pseudothauera rhizosphaerae]|uniref:ATP-binding cassette domain-containing protein n=1 Tax=Pseudothauera rhizosphaerae TaxID=2565932 RepID=A0A4S4ACU5_9RHOO|nr:ATP-binding cassette domain-containing protein [Pseudothauera rhizosphaerae]THF56891.1 ATP-binding cassette domain-containing protein [Pseudothauera rhizosphaerae]
MSALHCADPDLFSFELHKRMHAARGSQAAHPAFELHVALSLRRGDCLAVLGASGAGKTTLLRLLAGLTPADGGHIHAFGRCWLDGARSLALPTRKRRIGYVFQDYALFPHMSVRGNVRFALRRGAPERLADELLETVGLSALAGRRPAQLSGGQQQRLALARAIAAEPDLLLLDEPLSALDAGLRRSLQDELIALRRRYGLTTLVVTHDPGEAVRLAGRAILLEGGRIVADATPAELFGGRGEALTLGGRVLDVEAGADGPLYRIDADGRTLLARAADGAALAPGSMVTLVAERWTARPVPLTPPQDAAAPRTSPG